MILVGIDLNHNIEWAILTPWVVFSMGHPVFVVLFIHYSGLAHDTNLLHNFVSIILEGKISYVFAFVNSSQSH